MLAVFLENKFYIAYRVKVYENFQIVICVHSLVYSVHTAELYQWVYVHVVCNVYIYGSVDVLRLCR